MTTRRTTHDRGAFYVRSAYVLLIALASATSAIAQTSPGVVGEVRVHGNHTTPDADILGIVGDVVGKPATDQLIAEMEELLTNEPDYPYRKQVVEELEHERRIKAIISRAIPD